MSTYENWPRSSHIVLGLEWEAACKQAEADARRAQAGWAKEIEDHRATMRKLTRLQAKYHVLEYNHRR